MIQTLCKMGGDSLLSAGKDVALWYKKVESLLCP